MHISGGVQHWHQPGPLQPGAGIEQHLHIHVVPRWIGDTNFMPVVAGTTVVPEALTELAAKLRAELAA